MGQNENNSFINKIPDLVKGWLVLLGLIAGFIIAFRSEKQLYSVIIAGTLFAAWLLVAFYVLLSRLPGTFSKKGIYRYERYRWFAFVNIGFVFGLLSAFLLFTSNRLYVSEAILGTATPTPESPTATILAPTATLPPTLTPTVTPTPTLTPIPPSPTPDYLFQDSFLKNENGWNLPTNSNYSSFYPNPSAKILGGKLQYGLSCQSNNTYSCEYWLLIPHITAKNFELEFDIATVSVSGDAPLSIGIKFRDKSSDRYVITISRKGLVSILLQGNGINDYLAHEVFSPKIKQELGETNTFRLVAKDSLFVLYANNSEVVRVEDGNIAAEGNIYLGLSFSSNGNYGGVEIDNLKIQNLP